MMMVDQHLHSLFTKKHEYHSAWHLTRIESYDGIEKIEFTYEAEPLAYQAPYNEENYKFRNFELGVSQTGSCMISNNGTGVEMIGGLDNHYTIGRRFLTEITCSFKTHKSEKLEFEYSDNTCTNSEATDRRLNNIKIYKGVGAANHKLTQHFSYDCLSNRLFLKDTGLRSPSETNYTLKPPYSFEYHSTALPPPNSFAQDKWGYYNGMINNTTLIPDSSIPGITWNGGANRSSVGSYAVAKNLIKVTYPTKGYTQYSYEANQVPNPASIFILRACTQADGCPGLFESCMSDLSDCGAAACVLPTEEVYDPVNFSTTVINNGYFIIRSASICGSGPQQRVAQPSNSSSSTWSGSAYINIINKSTGLSVGQYNKSFTSSPLLDTIKLSTYFNIQVGTPYEVIIQGTNTRTTADTQIGSLSNSVPLSIGGVRIKSIKHYDRNNIFLKGRRYKYLDQNGAESSGIIVQKPSFAELGSYTFNKPNELQPGGNDCQSYGYTTVRLTASASYPLGSYDGSFYGYSRVEEIDLLNAAETATEGKRVYYFHNKPQIGSLVDVVENSKIERLELFDSKDRLVKDEVNQYAFDIGEKQREQNFYGFTVSAAPDQDNDIFLYKTTSGAFLWTNDADPQPDEDTSASPSRKTYKSKWERSSNDYMKLTNHSAFLTQKAVTHYYYDLSDQLTGQVTEVVSYDYSSNLDVVQPSTSSSTNSNGDVHRMEYKYPAEYNLNTSIRNSLINRNIILPAWQTEHYYNDDLIDGQRTQFAYYSLSTGIPTSTSTPMIYPLYSDRYERSWNKPVGSQSIGSLAAGTWDTRQTEAKSYDKDTGKPTVIRREHWPHDDVYVYDDVGHVLSHTYDGYASYWSFHADSYLLDKKTAIDGTSQSHNYDGLLRLKTIKDDNRNVVSTLSYIYTNTHNGIRTSTLYPRLGNTQRTLDDYEFYDDLGRSIQTLEHKQGPTASQSVVAGRSYDKIGRVQYEYEPVAVANTTSPIILSGDKTSIVYDGSPLNRQAQVIQPETWMKTSYVYGTNAAGEVAGYAPNQLYKIDQYDGNDTLTTVFTDQRGQEILTRRVTYNKFGSQVLHDNYNYYDGKDRLTTTRPPGATLFNTDLLFRKAYAPNDLLVYEHIPGKGEITYTNSNRGQLIYRQDPLMKAHDAALHYTYSYDGYGNLTGEGWRTTTIPANDATNNGAPNIQCAIHTYGTAGITTGKVTRSGHDLITTHVSGTQNGPRYDSYFFYNGAGLLSRKEWNHPLSPGAKSLKEYYSYDSADNLIQTSTDFKAISSDPIEYNMSTVIDHANRPKEQWYGQGSSAQQQLAAYSYTAKDEFSQLTVGGDIEQISYSYLKNSLPKNQLSPHFKSYLYYNSSTYGTQPRKNGDISAWYWQNDNTAHHYTYDYDGMDRLSAAKKSNAIKSGYSSNYSYDKRGNMLHLSRRNAGGGLIDSLRYSYNMIGNRMSSISDQAGSLDAHGYNGSSTRTYAYDANGNIRSDQSRGITSTYNHHDLPFEITENSSNKIKYDYDFGGGLLSIHQTDNGSTSTTHYIGNVEYEGGQIKRINHGHGYFEMGSFTAILRNVSGPQNVDQETCAETIRAMEIIGNSADVKYWAEECIELNPPFEVKSGAVRSEIRSRSNSASDAKM